MKRDKKSVFKTLSLLFVSTLLIVFTVNILIDPWGEYRLLEHGYNRYKKEVRSSSLGPLLSKLSQKPHVLVFGTSRSAKINSQMLGDDVLNLSMEVYGKPENVYRFFHLLDGAQRSHIKKVYYLLDEHTFGNFWKDEILYESPFDLELDKLTNINIGKIGAAIETIRFNDDIASGQLKDYAYFNTEGSQINVISQEKRAKRQAFDPNLDFYKTIVSSNQLKYLSKLDTFLEKERIPIFYFNTPMYFENASDIKTTSLGLIRRYALYLENIDHIHDYYYLSHLFRKDEFSDNNHLNTRGMKKLVDMILQDARKIEKGKFQKFYSDNYAIPEEEFSSMLKEGKKRYPLDTEIEELLENHTLDYESLYPLIHLLSINSGKFEDEKIFSMLLKAIKRIKDTEQKIKLSSIIFRTAVQTETMFDIFMNEKMPYDSAYFDGKSRLHIIMYSLPDDRNTWINRGIKRLLQDKETINSADDRGTTPLQLAIKQSRHKSLQGLLLAGADPNSRDILGNTPLHYAVDQRDFFAVKMLLAFDADPLITDNRHISPLEVSSTFDELSMMDEMLSYIDTPDAEMSLKFSERAHGNGNPTTPLEIVKKLSQHPCHTNYDEIEKVISDADSIYANVDLTRLIYRQCFNAQMPSYGSRLFINSEKFRNFLSNISCQKITLETPSQKKIMIQKDECEILKNLTADNNLYIILQNVRNIKGDEIAKLNDEKVLSYLKDLLTSLKLEYTLID